MSLYTFNASIANRSGFTLNLNTEASSNIIDSQWPASIPFTQTMPINATGNGRICATAIYDVVGTNAQVMFQYYDAVFGIGHCSISLESAGAYLTDSSISCDNVGTPSSTNTPPLRLAHTGTSIVTKANGSYTVGPLSF